MRGYTDGRKEETRFLLDGNVDELWQQAACVIKLSETHRYSSQCRQVETGTTYVCLARTTTDLRNERVFGQRIWGAARGGAWWKGSIVRRKGRKDYNKHKLKLGAGRTSRGRKCSFPSTGRLIYFFCFDQWIQVKRGATPHQSAPVSGQCYESYHRFTPIPLK